MLSNCGKDKVRLNFLQLINFYTCYVSKKFSEKNEFFTQKEPTYS